jgi:hypothetical protein
MMLHIVASLTDNPRGIIYSCKMFLVQATIGFAVGTTYCTNENRWVTSMPISIPKSKHHICELTKALEVFLIYVCGWLGSLASHQ